MAQEVTNFARFYTLFNKLPCTGDREEFKKSIVLQYTWNRTDSLKEMRSLLYGSGEAERTRRMATEAA